MHRLDDVVEGAARRRLHCDGRAAHGTHGLRGALDLLLAIGVHPLGDALVAHGVSAAQAVRAQQNVVAHAARRLLLQRPVRPLLLALLRHLALFGPQPLLLRRQLQSLLRHRRRLRFAFFFQPPPRFLDLRQLELRQPLSVQLHVHVHDAMDFDFANIRLGSLSLSLRVELRLFAPRRLVLLCEGLLDALHFSLLVLEPRRTVRLVRLHLASQRRHLFALLVQLSLCFLCALRLGLHLRQFHGAGVGHEHLVLVVVALAFLAEADDVAVVECVALADFAVIHKHAVGRVQVGDEEAARVRVVVEAAVCSGHHRRVCGEYHCA